MPGAVRYGSEFLVNSFTPGAQITPARTGLADGRCVVTWMDESRMNEDHSRDLHAQIFSADGHRLGNEILVPTTNAGDQIQPSIAAFAGGGFIVSWSSQADIRGQIFNPDDTRLGSEFPIPISSQGLQYYSDIGALPDGRFVVAWSDENHVGNDQDSFAVRARIFNADRSAATVEFQVNTTMAGLQANPAIAVLATGRFVVAWNDGSGADGSDYGIQAQIFNGDGTRFGGEFVVNTTTRYPQYQPTITALTDGRFVVSWTDVSGTAPDTSTAVRAQIFTADGARW